MSALRFDHVTKKFVHHSGPMLIRDHLKELFKPASRPTFEALKDISFELEQGESLALVGANGAGKSTLLNLATGLSRPDAGTITVNGRVSALLELGAGFHPDLTGAENIRVNAALNALTRRELAAKFEEIVDFSGVREFIHEPLRVYSSGMTMRLAFSVAVSVNPDILIMDEVIGMGDQAFYAKCLDKVQSFQKAGKTILLATHSTELVKLLCQRAIWIHQGHAVKIGPANEVVEAYKAA
jgi:ABC-type polysaccharide/polyol phosphate transport system ATPase subunit